MNKPNRKSNSKTAEHKSVYIENQDNDLVIVDEQVVFCRDDRHYRIRGLEKNLNYTRLSVNIMASRDKLVHVDTLDLHKARSRKSFIRATADELFVDEDTVKKDIGQLLLKLETLQNQQIEAAKRPEQLVPDMTKTERDTAMLLLKSPKLLDRIGADIEACGMVGEQSNTLVGYLAATSRLLSRPLAIVIQSSSSAGKTSLMEAILAMMPTESQLRFTGMTAQSLYYLPENSITHKTLAISEEEGIAKSVYALKLLQSEGELRHATVGKTADGRTATQQFYVKGPAQIFLTTTAMDIDEELMNRCLVLTVDETRAQTDAIQMRQRQSQTLDSLKATTNADQLRKLHQNAQRLLRPLRVFNPYAPQLTFASNKTRLRRDHQKYLTLIDTIALLRQYQRTVHQLKVGDEIVEYINVIPNDIALANQLASQVLGRSLDELSPQTRNFLAQLSEYAQRQSESLSVGLSDFRFTRRDIREATGWSDFQVRTHLNKLVALEYVLTHRGRNGQRYVYELLYDGQGHDGKPFMMGLVDLDQLTEPASSTPKP